MYAAKPKTAAIKYNRPEYMKRTSIMWWCQTNPSSEDFRTSETWLPSSKHSLAGNGDVLFIHMGVSKNRGFYLKSSHFNRVFHYKPSILGYHYFWKHPYIHQPFQVPKMEVLYPIRLSWVWGFPYVSLTYSSGDSWMYPDPNVPGHGKSLWLSPITRGYLWVSYPQESQG